ncbi:MAG: MotA/TolQ/ExbB proton channel family protein [Verrucomicrobiota bacterium]
MIVAVIPIAELFDRTGWFMIPLGLCSVISLAVILQRLLALRRDKILPEPVLRVLSGKGESDPVEIFQRYPSTLSTIGLAALAGRHRNREEAAAATQATAREEVTRLQNGLTTLEVIITIAPLLGLLGTVSGLVKVFSRFGDAANTVAIANGISEALYTTIVGIAIAVPTVVAHSFFQKKIESLAVRMEVLLQETLQRHY